MPRQSFAYLFERFPSFVQTFVYREAVEMVRQQMNPWLVSIREPEDAAEVAERLEVEVFYLPAATELRAEIDALREGKKLPGRISRAINHARQETDSNRVFEAAWLGPRLRRAGIGHVHAHFAGLAARTAWWLRKFHGVSYSFTGHANDIFCETDYPISNADLVRDAKFIVTESDFARQWMETKHPRARGKTFRVYNGIDDDFPPRQASDGVPRILSVGRLVEKKGFADLIEACRQLRAREISFVCSIVGEGPLEAELRAQIDRASLGGAVRLLGPRSQIDVRQLLAGSQLFVLACVPEADGGSDNLPTVVMEAMMCGLPVVSTRVAGIPEMLDHGENGLLVAPGDPPALALAIEQLLRDDSVAQLFAERARRTALGKFAIQTTTRALKQLLVRRARVNPPPSALELDPGLARGLFRRWFR